MPQLTSRTQGISPASTCSVPFRCSRTSCAARPAVAVLERGHERRVLLVRAGEHRRGVGDVRDQLAHLALHLGHRRHAAARSAPPRRRRGGRTRRRGGRPRSRSTSRIVSTCPRSGARSSAWRARPRARRRRPRPRSGSRAARASGRSLSWTRLLSASGGASDTNVPPPRPRSATRWPLSVSDISAWRSVERAIPSWSASSRSGGSRSPGPSSPRRIAVPRRSTVSSRVVAVCTGSNTAATAGEGPASRRTLAPGAGFRQACAAVIDDALRALEPQLGPAESEPVPLDGGITNRNYRVRFAGRDCVVRLPGKDTELLGIDREAERAATRRRPRPASAPTLSASSRAAAAWSPASSRRAPVAARGAAHARRPRSPGRCGRSTPARRSRRRSRRSSAPATTSARRASAAARSPPPTPRLRAIADEIEAALDGDVPCRATTTC